MAELEDGKGRGANSKDEAVGVMDLAAISNAMDGKQAQHIGTVALCIGRKWRGNPREGSSGSHVPCADASAGAPLGKVAPCSKSEGGVEGAVVVANAQTVLDHGLFDDRSIRLAGLIKPRVPV
ncbi:hypothetical protein V2G26_003477 [Clonostachys chloroleuca]